MAVILEGGTGLARVLVPDPSPWLPTPSPVTARPTLPTSGAWRSQVGAEREMGEGAAPRVALGAAGHGCSASVAQDFPSLLLVLPSVPCAAVRCGAQSRAELCLPRRGGAGGEP